MSHRANVGLVTSKEAISCNDMPRFFGYDLEEDMMYASISQSAKLQPEYGEGITAVYMVPPGKGLCAGARTRDRSEGL